MSSPGFIDLPIEIINIIVSAPFTDALDSTMLSRVNKTINKLVRGQISRSPEHVLLQHATGISKYLSMHMKTIVLGIHTHVLLQHSTGI